jgi:CHAD domain-containing protein
MAKAEPITGLNSQASTRENALLIARAKIVELYGWSEYVDRPYAIRELHNMRISAKRLRYTLEIFEDILADETKAAREEIVQLQEELGLIHDSDVMVALLRLCLASQEEAIDEQKKQEKSFLPPDLVPILLDTSYAPDTEQRYGLEQLLRRSEQERKDRYQAFHQHWQQLQEQDFRQHLFTILE